MEKDDLLYRNFEFNVRDVNEEKREVALSFSSETEEVERWFGIEVLSHNEGAGDLGALRQLGSFLYNHTSEIIGPIRSARIENGRGVAVVGFDETDDGEKRFIQVKNGSLRGISFGYQPIRMKELLDKEEYKLSTKTVRGCKGKSKYIVEKWRGREISATPLPWDTSVGIGRAATRSLDGIYVIQSTKDKERKMGDENKLDKDEIRNMVKDELKNALKEAMPEIAGQIRTQIKEEAKPKLAVELDTFKDLVNRASAVSTDTAHQVTTMALEGKTEPELLRFLNDTIMKNTDAKDLGGNEDDGTKRNKKTQGPGGTIRSFEGVDDEQFFAALKTPVTFAYH